MSVRPTGTAGRGGAAAQLKAGIATVAGAANDGANE
jgi:hypothetical protein